MSRIAKINDLDGVVPYRQHLAGATELGDLWSTPWENLRDAEIIPGSPLGADQAVLPLSWASTKRQRRLGNSTVDFGAARRAGLDESAVRRLKRLATILLITPITFANGSIRQPSSPPCWAGLCRAMIKAAIWLRERKSSAAVPSRCPDGSPFFASIDRSDLDAMPGAGLKGFVTGVAPKLAALDRMGLIDDWPRLPQRNRPEGSRRGVTLPDAELVGRRWQPFPDVFVARLGKAALWMTEELGPPILGALEAVRAVPLEGKRGTPQPPRSNIVCDRRRMAIKAWTEANLEQQIEFPHAFVVHESPRSAPTLLQSWPPPNWRVLRELVMHLQASHLIIVALSTAARESELTALERDCLRSTGDRDLLQGQTFKLSDPAAGETRNWPLPKIAVAAITQQRALADLLAPKGRMLWVAFKNYDAPDSNEFSDLKTISSGPLRSFTRDILMDGAPLRDWCDGNVHAHRFRKTVARLAALSLVGATSILFDILGHRDPEMTLNYILSDPGLQDEIRKIAAEANLVMAQQAVARADDNGGYAAPLVADLKQRIAVRSGEDELGSADITEAAEILSMNGQVTMVKPGVLCTKTTGQRGACTKASGFPDIGNCSTGCHHRLEHAAAADDCAKAIERILSEMPPPENIMMRGWWQAQLIGQLRRFPLLRRRYLTEERVQMALAGIHDATMEELLPTPGEWRCRGDAA